MSIFSEDDQIAEIELKQEVLKFLQDKEYKAKKYLDTVQLEIYNQVEDIAMLKKKLDERV